MKTGVRPSGVASPRFGNRQFFLCFYFLRDMTLSSTYWKLPAVFIMYYVLCIMYYVLFIMYYLLCIMYYVLFIMYYVLCIIVESGNNKNNQNNYRSSNPSGARGISSNGP